MIFSIMHILHFLSAFMCLPVILALQFVEFHFLEKKNCPVVYFVWREATNDRESFNLGPGANKYFKIPEHKYDSLSDVGEIRVYQRADFQSGSRVLKKVF